MVSALTDREFFHPQESSVSKIRKTALSSCSMELVGGGGGGGGGSIGRARLLVRRSGVQFPLWPPAPYWLGRCQYNMAD